MPDAYERKKLREIMDAKARVDKPDGKTTLKRLERELKDYRRG